ncbi:peptidoglycan DD-metalloendopeptidase family protein [Phreatobacter sp.]|uniref:peptidoglycan DD-metalloendopeptidase family protein n=1 Tax=Phreatobacter sp. TaxID=1966341 RepID=UPI003F7106E3
MRNRAFAGLSKAAMIVAVAGLGAGCSADVARFDENPFRSQQVASAPPPAPVQSVPVAQVESQPLPPASGVASNSGSPFGAPSDTGLTTGSATPRFSANPQTPAVSRMAQSHAPAAPAGRGGWSAAGGTGVRATGAETVDSLSHRYGVPARAIAEANGVPQGHRFAAGQNVVIPTYSMAGAPVAASPPDTRRSGDLVRQPAAPADRPRIVQTQPIAVAPRRESVPAAAPTPRMAWQQGANPAASSRPAPVAAAPATTATTSRQPARAASHQVTSGETLSSVARKHGVTRASLAQANGMAPNASLRIGQTLRLPGAAAPAAVAARPAPAAVAARPAPAAVPTPVARQDQARRTVAAVQATPAGRQADPRPTAAIPPAEPARAASRPSPAVALQPDVANAPAPQAETPAAEAPAAAAAAPASDRAPQFRWPVRGRVVAGFRAGTNDGIKLSVPEGTAVKAAEDGVVAYAGNELRNYGNLVLVRHSNGFVTAYAHNSRVNVRRGDQVRRGQTIAQAGQTGNVSSPQVHFEIRRGATPVDPMSMLAGN